MSNSKIANLLLGIVMVSFATLSFVFPPPYLSSGNEINFDLEKIIPKDFDDWNIDISSTRLIVNPSIRNDLIKIYNRVLSRIYINKNGERIMLSIAYGSMQKSDMHAHRPEICYTATGFEIGEVSNASFDTTFGRIPLNRLVAKQGTRIEPISYWIRIGKSLTQGWLDQKFTAIRYGLTGDIPDGLLFRVSSISNNEKSSYHLQELFLNSILHAVRNEDRYLLLGQLAP